MNGLDIGNVPLSALHAQLTTADFAHALVARWRKGDQAEVKTFFLTCDGGDLSQLRHLRGDECPWWSDFELWRQMLGLFAQRCLYLGCDSAVRVPSQAFSQEVEAIAQAVLASTHPAMQKEGPGFVISSLFGYLNYPGISRDECLRLINWAQTLRVQAGIAPDRDFNTEWQGLIESLTDTADLITLAGQGGQLCKLVLYLYSRRVEKMPAHKRWLPWQDFFASQPALFDRYLVRDLGLIAQRWIQADAPRRAELADDVIRLCLTSRSEWKHREPLFIQLVTEEPALFARVLDENGSDPLALPMAQTLWQMQHEALTPLLLPLIAAEARHKSFAPLIHELLAARPDDLLRVTPVKLVNLLPLLDAATLKTVLPRLAKVAANSSSKALREALARCAGQLAPGDFVEAGWLGQKSKNLLLAYRDVLLAHADPAAGPLLAQLLASGQLDVGSASTVQAHLDKTGVQAVATPAAAAVLPESLEALEAEAAKVKRIAGAVKHFDAVELLALLQPLSEHAARVLFHLAATAEGELPPLAGQLLAQVPAERQARLALGIAQVWIALDGDPKQRWALKLVSGRSDDRLVDSLTAAALAWGKPKKQRAVIAVEHLGALDSLYALARVQEISSSNKVKDLVHYTAREILVAAAKRRKISLEELYDELTPDFGLGEGLTLNVGERIYRVLLQGDLSLRVVDENGKVSKGIPALKDESARVDWEAASAQLKTLAAGLKTVLKQQVPRMEAALFTANSWPVERWQRLFLEHPLLRIVGRSLIWQVVEAGKLPRASFRIAEDFSLLDVEHNPLSLPSGASICLWHPVTARAGEGQAWKIHLADYELEPLLDQLGACATLPEPAQIKDGHLRAPEGLRLEQGKLAGILSKCGYRAGPVEDGPGIYLHQWLLPAAQLSVQLIHSQYMPYMDLTHSVDIEGFVVQAQAKSKKIADLPKPLLATLMGHLQLMASKAKVAQPA